MWAATQESPNLRTPQTFNDWVQWLKLFDQTPYHVERMDKICVRSFVAERIGTQYVTRMIRQLNEPSELLTMSVSEPFVVKATHDSGSVIRVPDPVAFDADAALRHFEIRLRARFGHASGEWPYELIRPRLIVEEMLTGPDPEDLPDYRFHCVDGQVSFVQFNFHRASETFEVLVERDASPLPILLSAHNTRGNYGDFVRPLDWDKMVWMAEELSRDLRYVRVDLFATTVGPRFAELTFFPYAGVYLGEGQRQLGSRIWFKDSTPMSSLGLAQRRRIRRPQRRCGELTEPPAEAPAPKD